MKMGFSRKFVALAMGGIYFLTQGVCAHVPESAFWAERRKLTERNRHSRVSWGDVSRTGGGKIENPIPPFITDGSSTRFVKNNTALFSALSPEFGTVRNISLPRNYSSTTPIVIHIQDVHRNFDAQKNIGAIVAQLEKGGQIDLMALEGTWGDLPLQPFRDYSLPEAVRMAADYLLKENYISGPVHGVLCGRGPGCPVVGIDDPIHYAANVKAYRQSVPLRSKDQKMIAQKRKELEHQKQSVYSPPLFLFDERVQSFRNRQTSLGDHLQTLLAFGKEDSLTPALRLYSEAVRLERMMDFNQVERDRKALLDRLSQRINPKQHNELWGVSVGFRSGKIPPAEFYEELTTLCRQAKIRLDHFPALDAYIRYVLMAGKVNPDSLYRDLHDLERDIYATLAQKPDELRLLAQSQTLYLIEKLVEFGLTPQEWQEYRSSRPEAVFPKEKLNLSPYAAFYEEARIRDQAMARHLLRAMGSRSARVAVAVTGGFHAEGLTNVLLKEDVAVVSVVPRIEKMDTEQGVMALSVFSQEKTPLEKLFEGQKLTLSTNPAPGWVVSRFLPVLTVVGTLFLLGPSVELDPQGAYLLLGGLGTMKVLQYSSVGALVQIFGSRIQIIKEGNNELAVSRVERIPWWEDLLGRAKSLSKRLVETKNHLKDQFSLADRLNPTQIRKEMGFSLTVGVSLTLLYFWPPLSGGVIFAVGAASLLWFLSYHRHMFGEVSSQLPEDLKDYAGWVYFPFVAVGFIVFTGLAAGAFVATVSTIQPMLGVEEGLYVSLAMAHVAFYRVGKWAHGISNRISPIPAVAAKSKGETHVSQLFDIYTLFKSAISKMFLTGKGEEMELKFSQEAIESVLSKAEKIYPAIRTLFPNGVPRDDFAHFIEVLNERIFIAHGFCLGDVRKYNRPLKIQQDSWRSLPFLGGAIRVAYVMNVGQKRGSSTLPSAAGDISGVIFIDPDEAVEKVEAKWRIYVTNRLSGSRLIFRNKLAEARLAKRQLVHAVLDWNARTSVARVKQSIFAARRNELSFYEAIGGVVSEAIVKPNSPLWALRAPLDDDSDIAAVMNWEATAPVVAQLLDGMIEHLFYLKHWFETFPTNQETDTDSEVKAHLLGTMAFIDMMQISNGEEPFPWKMGTRWVIDQLKIEISEDASSPMSDDELSSQFFKGSLDSYEKLLSVTEKIREKNLLLPEERFYLLHDRAPNSDELRELTTAMEVVKPISGKNEFLRPSVSGLKGSASLVRTLVDRAIENEGPTTERETNIRGLVADINNLIATYDGSSTMDEFSRLYLEMAGGETSPGGIRQRASPFLGDNRVRDCSVKLEDVLAKVARAICEKAVARNTSLNTELVSAIEDLIALRNNDAWMESVGREQTEAIESLLESDRVMLAARDPNSFEPAITPLSRPELFGLDEQEIAFLSKVSKGSSEEVDCPFDLVGLSLLRKKLGRFSSEEIRKIKASGSAQAPQGLPETVVMLEGYEIYIAPEIEDQEWSQFSIEIMREISDGLRRCEQDRVMRSKEKINPMASGLALSGKNLRGIQRGYIQGGSKRVYFRFIDEGEGNGKGRKVLAILGIENKGNTSSGFSGKMNPELVKKLEPFSQASSFGNPLFRKYRPFLESSTQRTKGRKSEAGIVSLPVIGFLLALALMLLLVVSVGKVHSVLVLGSIGAVLLGWVIHNEWNRFRDLFFNVAPLSPEYDRGPEVFAGEVERTVVEKAMVVERFLALGDVALAWKSFNEILSLRRDLNAPLLESYVKILKGKINRSEKGNRTFESGNLFLLLEIMEDSLYSGDWKALFGAMDLIDEKHEFTTKEQRKMVKLWKEIILVMEKLNDPNWAELDTIVSRLSETGRVLLAQHGLFRPHLEKVLFRFVWSYWAFRESGNRLPFSGVPYVSTLERVLKKIPAISMGFDELSDLIGKYINGHSRISILKEFERGGLSPTEAGELLFNVDVFTKVRLPPKSGISNPPGGKMPGEASGMHRVGGKMTEADRVYLQAAAGAVASLQIRRAWAASLEKFLAHPVRGGNVADVGLGPVLQRLINVLTMEEPEISTSFGVVPVQFRLLSGSFAEGAPGTPRANWEYTPLPRQNNKPTLGITVTLHEDDLAAVIHEGIEVIFEDRSVAHPAGKAHTYAFLAESLANSSEEDDLVPQRALDEINSKNPMELKLFLQDSSSSRAEIENLTEGPLRALLLKVHESLLTHALSRSPSILSTPLGQNGPLNHPLDLGVSGNDRVPNGPSLDPRFLLEIVPDAGDRKNLQRIDRLPRAVRVAA